jgi:hypothetical protein
VLSDSWLNLPTFHVLAVFGMPSEGVGAKIHCSSRLYRAMAFVGRQLPGIGPEDIPAVSVVDKVICNALAVFCSDYFGETSGSLAFILCLSSRNFFPFCP